MNDAFKYVATALCVHFFYSNILAPGYNKLTSSLFVKAGKSIADHVLRIGSIQLLSKHGEKHSKVDWAWRFVHHSLQILICGVLTWKVDNNNEYLWSHLKGLNVFKIHNCFYLARQAYREGLLCQWNRPCFGQSYWRPPWTPEFETGQT